MIYDKVEAIAHTDTDYRDIAGCAPNATPLTDRDGKQYISIQHRNITISVHSTRIRVVGSFDKCFNGIAGLNGIEIAPKLIEIIAELIGVPTEVLLTASVTRIEIGITIEDPYFTDKDGEPVFFSPNEFITQICGHNKLKRYSNHYDSNQRLSSKTLRSGWKGSLRDADLVLHIYDKTEEYNAKHQEQTYRTLLRIEVRYKRPRKQLGISQISELTDPQKALETWDITARLISGLTFSMQASEESLLKCGISIDDIELVRTLIKEGLEAYRVKVKSNTTLSEGQKYRRIKKAKELIRKIRDYWVTFEEDTLRRYLNEMSERVRANAQATPQIRR